MLAVKFKADVHDGVIEIPVEYQATLKNHVEVIALVHEDIKKEAAVQYSDEYIEAHWREMIAQGLSHYDASYYKSEQYMLDRGKEGAEKYA